MDKRGSGILLHVTSIKTDYGIGDFGPSAYEFIDFLEETNQKYWQILPLNPTATIMLNSPYSSYSAFAIETLFISPQKLHEEGLVSLESLNSIPQISSNKTDYHKATEIKEKLFDEAYKNFDHHEHHEYKEFCQHNKSWLNDHALFYVLKKKKPTIWTEWESDYKNRKKDILDKFYEKNKNEIQKEMFLQFMAFKQWKQLKQYAHQKNIQIIGDIPIYVTQDSVDVWKSPEQFQLNDEKNPIEVAGVPPDYFSETGQLWGNPLYNWDIHKETGFSWWLSRIRHSLELYDIIRIDHFRGLVGYWAVPYGEETAINGKWKYVPVYDLFNAIQDKFHKLPIIAEDLGYITDDVREAMAHFDLPGMRILMFAFGQKDPVSHFLPHNYVKNCMVYTGTHDNNTLHGWYQEETNAIARKHLDNYAGHKIQASNIHWELIRMAFASAANTVITPMQDIMGLRAEHRMNTPSTIKNNWVWQYNPDDMTGEIVEELKRLTVLYER